MNYTLNEIADIVGGRHIGANTKVYNIIYDSRKLSSSKLTLFVAIKGTPRDGHDYISELIEKGVKAFIVNNTFDSSNFSKEIGFVVVEDSVSALQVLATHHRQKMDTKVVAIAGSSGKTIVKEWIYKCWNGGKFFKSPRSYNSQIGVALSLLMLKGDEQLAIIETAISKCGEMKNLHEMVKPNIVLFTNIGNEHQENFDSIEQKITEKLNIAKEATTIIYCADQPRVSKEIKGRYSSKRLFSWGKSDDADLKIVEYAKGYTKFNFKDTTYTIPLHLNSYDYENLMSVISLYACEDYNIAKVCSRCVNLQGVEVRMKVKNGINNCTVVTDTASTDLNSLKISLESLDSLTNKPLKIAIFSELYIDNSEELSKILEENNLSKIFIIGGNVKKSLTEYKGEIAFFDTIENFKETFNNESFSEMSILLLGSNISSLTQLANLFEEKKHSTVMEVNLSAMSHNLNYYRSKLQKGVKIVAMVKASSYGSGTGDVALALTNEDIDYLAVAYLDEGIELREADIETPIIILNSNINDYNLILDNNLQPEIYSFYTLNKFIDICRERGFEKYPIHIKLDTGMSRLGFQPSEITTLRETLENTDIVTVESIFSHFSCADMPDKDAETHRQAKLYEDMASQICEGLHHICNSSAIERFPEYQKDMVRLGIGLYGINPIGLKSLENVCSLHTNILQIRNIKKGTHIGYAMRGVAEEDITIATVGIGYADGLLRGLGNGRWAMKVNNHKAVILGNICMDTCMIDVTELNVKEGDRVTIFDSSKDICQMAQILNTIPYEILTTISSRIKRVYIKE